MQPPAQAHHHQSYYAVLGVQPGATAAEIRAAYHRLAMVSTSYELLRSDTQSLWYALAPVDVRKQSMTHAFSDGDAEVAPGQDRRRPRGSNARGGGQEQVPADTRGVPR